MLAEYFEVSPQDIIDRMQEPRGIMQLMKGELFAEELEKIRNESESRLAAALELVILMEASGNSPDELKHLIQYIMELRNNSRILVQKSHGHITVKKFN